MTGQNAKKKLYDKLHMRKIDFWVIVSMLIINIRYFLMSLSVSQKVDEEFTIGKRMIASYGITDEIFAVSVSTCFCKNLFNGLAP